MEGTPVALAHRALRAPAPTRFRAMLRKKREELDLDRYDVSVVLAEKLRTKVRESDVRLCETGPQPMWKLTEEYANYLARLAGKEWAQECFAEAVAELKGRASAAGASDITRAIAADKMLHKLAEKPVSKKAARTGRRSLNDMQAAGAISSAGQSARLLSERSSVRVGDGAHPTRGGKTTVTSPGAILDLTTLFTKKARKPHTRFALGA